jgi:dihydroorotate dehydrogenase electron transfer subunit
VCVGDIFKTMSNCYTSYPSTMMPTVDEYPVTVLNHTAYDSGLYHLVLQFGLGVGHGKAHTPIPGQFFMLDIPDTQRGFGFRRPFSLYRWNPETQVGEVVYKVAGQGTARMATWKEGDTTVVLSSLGVGVPEAFSTHPERVLLMGGGVGIAPLALWAESLSTEPPNTPTLVFGVRSALEAEPLTPHLNTLFSTEKLNICTDDGSAGWHGNPKQWLEAHHSQLSNIHYVLICGPNRMMQGSVEVARWVLPQAEVYVSLENHMPCGTGACYGCVVAPASPQQLPFKVCETGPVLRADTIQWNATGPETQCFTLDKTTFPSLDLGDAHSS